MCGQDYTTRWSAWNETLAWWVTQFKGRVKIQFPIQKSKKYVNYHSVIYSWLGWYGFKTKEIPYYRFTNMLILQSLLCSQSSIVIITTSQCQSG